MNLFAPAALLSDGWARDVRITIAGDGTIAAVARGVRRAANDDVLEGYVIPGMPNPHSHAFQHAFAGRAEPRGGSAETFWSWRSTMYRYANALDPDALQAVATLAYVEMAARGYTSVVEFHYLHHDRDGTHFADPAEMSERVVAAARRAGIGLTLLPVLYAHGDAGGVPLASEQRRFAWDVDGVLGLFETLAARHGDAGLRVGVAPHSLRAVTPDELSALVSAVTELDECAPVHIHVAEQRAEVERVRAVNGSTPLRCLAETIDLDRRWSLVHCTHAEEEELRAAAASGATIVLTPSTEANLGDGVFPLSTYTAAGGAIAIGSDSNVTISVADELRWLAYVERLRREERVAGSGAGSAGEALYTAALRGGAAAAGRAIGELAPGLAADLLVLDARDVALEGIELERLLDAFIFTAGDRLVRDVMAKGRWIVRDRAHAAREASEDAYRRVRRRLRDAVG